MRPASILGPGALAPLLMIVRVAQEPFLKAHHAEIVDFLEDYLHTLQYLLDPASFAGEAGRRLAPEVGH